jgi:hypothetical protein
MTHERLSEIISELLQETFESVQGVYLDKGASLFETLSSVTAEEASRPVGNKCATLAAQVDHTRFFIDVLMGHMTGTTTARADWRAIWETVAGVSPEEWDAINQRLRASYDALRQHLNDLSSWDEGENLDGALSIAIHTAYHLGEIRQALCTLR